MKALFMLNSELLDRFQDFGIFSCLHHWDTPAGFLWDFIRQFLF
jgi:hypothetical protein